MIITVNYIILTLDSALNLDSLLIQLKPQVTSKWKEFANVVGLSNIIKQLAKYSPDECIVEVCDQWLKSQPNNPTWRDVANVVKEIGLYELANNILMAYETGVVAFSNCYSTIFIQPMSNRPSLS